MNAPRDEHDPGGRATAITALVAIAVTIALIVFGLSRLAEVIR